MLLSIPLRLTLLAAIGATILIVAGVGWLAPPGEIIGAQLALVRWTPLLLLAFVFSLYWSWRLVKPLQRVTFPYLGGDWTGTLRYKTHDGKSGEKPAQLRVRHDFFGLHLQLITDESTSRTLAIAPERDPTFGDFRLYYVFVVSRTAGVGSDHVYRGTALVQIAPDLQTLSGHYFTEHKSTGEIVFKCGGRAGGRD
jgi:hypothetical protein